MGAADRQGKARGGLAAAAATCSGTAWSGGNAQVVVFAVHNYIVAVNLIDPREGPYNI